MYGCFQHHKTCNVFHVRHDENDAERGSYISLVYGEAVNGVTREKDPDYHGKYYVFRTAMNLSHAFQILFQVCPLSETINSDTIGEQGDDILSLSH